MWNGHDRGARLPDDWAQIRKRVLERDGYRCQWLIGQPAGETHVVQRCGVTATDVDHIEHGDNHAETNLQALCSYHHRRKSSGEGGRAASARRASTRRQPERHPGLRH